MENINFIQQKELFSLNTLKCLRNEYLYNDCQLCFSQCPTQALDLFKGKIRLFTEQCTQCGECIGICPTEALSLENFDVNGFVFEFINSEKNQIIEKIDIPTFSMFDSYHLISIVLRSKQNIFLEYDDNISEHALNYIESVVQNANYFLAFIGSESSLFLKPFKKELQDHSRRNLFRQLVQTNKELNKEIHISARLNEHEKNVPAKHILFKNSLKLVCEDIQQQELQVNHEHTIVFSKIIDFERCTNCVECITFCPTQALFQNSTKDAIYFQSGKCIGCQICEQVCQPNAIKTHSNLNIIDHMFDRAHKLVEFEYIKCSECNGAFINKNQGNVCERCSDYKNNFDKMFVLAKDI